MEAHLASLDADTVRLIQQLQLEDLAEVSNIGESAYRECPSLEASLDKNNPDVVAMYNQEAADRQLAESCSAIRRDDAALIEAMLQEDNQTIEYQYGALYDCQHPVESEVEDDFEPEANQEQFRNDKLIHQDDYDSENTPYHDVAGDWSGMASSQAAAVSYDNDSPPLPSQPSSVDPTSRDGPGGALQITDGPDDGIRHECISCGAHFQHSLGSVLEAPCGHHYCHGCLNRLVDAALKDDSLFPPRCCSQAIPLDGQPFLSAKQSLLCIEKQREMETVDRTYCHKVGCSKFIWVEGESSAESVLVCPACEARTCSLCKGADHKNEECPNDTHAQMVLALAKENKWQRCFKCRSVVELDIGCNHMTCRCGSEFCYVCGQRWKKCDCPQWEEERLIRRTEVVAEQDRMAGQGVNRQAIRERIERNHNCDHDGQWQRRDVNEPEGARCTECRQIMHTFIFTCRRCHILACRRCRFNRI